MTVLQKMEMDTIGRLPTKASGTGLPYKGFSDLRKHFKKDTLERWVYEMRVLPFPSTMNLHIS